MTTDPPERDVDKEFESLIAGWDATVFNDPRGHEVKDPVLPAQTPEEPGPDVNIWRGPTTWRPAERAFDEGPSGVLDDDDDDEDFTPRPVRLPPQEDLHFWGIVAGLLGGGLLLLYVAVTGRSLSSWWSLAAIALFIGGFVLLILRQPEHRDSTDDGTRV
ncbi:MAG: hypothetical protein GX344_08245 [Intrasporangiaceae bacterium]|nr:hypothetical protein [Intrasporangiaceae bacterium]